MKDILKFLLCLHTKRQREMFQLRWKQHLSVSAEAHTHKKKTADTETSIFYGFWVINLPSFTAVIVSVQQLRLGVNWNEVKVNWIWWKHQWSDSDFGWFIAGQEACIVFKTLPPADQKEKPAQQWDHPSPLSSFLHAHTYISIINASDVTDVDCRNICLSRSRSLWLKVWEDADTHTHTHARHNTNTPVSLHSQLNKHLSSLTLTILEVTAGIRTRGCERHTLPAGSDVQAVISVTGHTSTITQHVATTATRRPETITSAVRARMLICHLFFLSYPGLYDSGITHVLIKHVAHARWLVAGKPFCRQRK